MPADQTSEPHSHSGRLRSSTAERERTAAILRAAAEAGLLTLDEADERLASCYQSQYRDELAPLLADLPDHGRGLVPPDPAEEAADDAARRVHKQSVGQHAGFVVFVGLVLFTIWAATGGGFFWPLFPLLFLGLSVVFHAKHRHHPHHHRSHHHGPRHHRDRWEARCARQHLRDAYSDPDAYDRMLWGRYGRDRDARYAAEH